MGRTYTQVVIYALLLGWYALSSAEIIHFSYGGVDIGRLLKNGELLISRSAPSGTASKLLHTNFYSFTHPNFEFRNHNWLAAIVFYLAWRAVDFEGLNAFYILLGALTFTLFFRMAHRAAGLPIAAAIAVILIPILRARPSVRPEIFTLLLAGVFMSLLLGYSEGRLNWRVLLLLPVLEALWVNLHFGFILGPAFVGAFLLGEWLSRSADRNARVKRLLPILCATAAATLLNPSGFRGAIYPLTFWTNYGFPVMENNSVIATLRLGYRSGLEPLVLAFAGLSLSFAITAIRGRRFPWAIFLLAILLSGLAWFAIRNVPLMALFSLSAISINIGLSGLRQDLLTGKTAILALGLVILAGVLYNAGTLVAKAPILGLGLLPGAGIPSAFLRDSHLEGPILNNFDTGGYLIQYAYPEYPVFIDSRPEAYPAAFIVEKYLKPLQNETLWKQLLEEYRFNIIFFSVLAPSDFQFVLRRAADPAWAPVFYDGDIFILVRRTAANLKFVQKYEIPKELLETAKIAM